MLYIFYGNDRLRALKATEAVLEKSNSSKRISFDESLENPIELLSLATINDLFAEKTFIKCDGVLESAYKEEVLKYTESFQESQNTFVFLENAIKADTLKILKKHSEKVEEFKIIDKKKEKFNIFEVSDAFGLRDKKTLWVLYTKALDAGKSGEEIVGTIFWQLKSMLLVSKGDASGLSPFVANKAKQFLKNYKSEEIEKMSFDLLKRYHESRRGRYDLETTLERFILSV
ncbi:MAG: hypothetical protein AAB513_02020 [Patescibacteria group bacterium]